MMKAGIADWQKRYPNNPGAKMLPTQLVNVKAFKPASTHRCCDRNFIIYQLQRKLMFFEDLIGCPTFRAIKFDDKTSTIFALKLIDTVFIAVKRGKTGIHPDPMLKQSVVALINPHKGKFNVTAKGGLVEEEYVDWVISRPYIFLVLLNLVGVAVGIWRYFYGPPTEMLTVVVSMVWVFYNLIVLGGAVAVSVESKQVRRSHRVEMTMPAAIAREDGHLFSCTVQDFSDGGLGIKINGQAQILEGQKVNLLLKRGQQEYVFPTQVARVMGNEVGLKLMPLTTQQHIDFVQCTFARADTWALWQDSYPEDKPLESLLDILKLGFRGYRHLAEFAPSSVKGIFRVLTSLVSWVVSFIPRRPERSETAQPSDQALAQQ